MRVLLAGDGSTPGDIAEAGTGGAAGSWGRPHASVVLVVLLIHADGV